MSYIEADTIVRTSSFIQQATAPTGLNRLSHTAVGGASYVFDDSAGVGITAFVVDTGIRTSHSVSEPAWITPPSLSSDAIRSGLIVVLRL